MVPAVAQSDHFQGGFRVEGARPIIEGGGHLNILQGSEGWDEVKELKDKPNISSAKPGERGVFCLFQMKRRRLVFLGIVDHLAGGRSVHSTDDIEKSAFP